jgi:hypothetical protein
MKFLVNLRPGPVVISNGKYFIPAGKSVPVADIEVEDAGIVEVYRKGWIDVTDESKTIDPGIPKIVAETHSTEGSETFPGAVAEPVSGLTEVPSTTESAPAETPVEAAPVKSGRKSKV